MSIGLLPILIYGGEESHIRLGVLEGKDNQKHLRRGARLISKNIRTYMSVVHTTILSLNPYNVLDLGNSLEDGCLIIRACVYTNVWSRVDLETAFTGSISQYTDKARDIALAGPEDGGIANNRWYRMQHSSDDQLPVLKIENAPVF